MAIAKRGKPLVLLTYRPHVAVSRRRGKGGKALFYGSRYVVAIPTNMRCFALKVVRVANVHNRLDRFAQFRAVAALALVRRFEAVGNTPPVDGYYSV
jgi:hypothetical protein